MLGYDPIRPEIRELLLDANESDEPQVLGQQLVQRGVAGTLRAHDVDAQRTDEHRSSRELQAEEPAIWLDA